MSTLLSGLSGTVLTVALCVVSAAAVGARPQQRPHVPSDSIPSQLLSDDERVEFCTQMRDASTAEERRAVADRMRDTLTPRAKTQGVELPAWLLDGRPVKGSGGAANGIPGLHCESSVAPSSSRTQAKASAKETPERKAPSREPPARATPPPDSPRGDVPVGHDRGIAYVTGGVGQDEANALRRISSGYTMRATFTTRSGEYLSGVDVQVSRSGTVVFAARTEGPYLFAQIPPGHYRVTATFDGVTRTRDLYVPEHSGVRFTLTWPELRAASSAG
jgi:hypothetical protein